MSKRLSKTDLNEDQLNALAFIKDFVNDPERRQMVLYGAAGTGKTSLINVLLDEFDAMGKDRPEYTCTAPTNKAVEVIAKRTGRGFDSTIYSLLGLVLQDFDDGKPKLKRENDGHLAEYEVVIVDEASMVSMMLLNEIQKQLHVFTSVKIIYVGDKCQIPPVDDANQGVLESVIFQLPLQFGLTKVMRTAEDNPILGVVTAMRTNMQTPVDLFKHETSVATDGTGIFFYELKNPFMDLMMTYFTSEKYKLDSNYALAVAYTNEAVDAINKHVRAAIYPNSTMAYEAGEEVRVVRTYGVETVIGSKKATTIYKTVYNIEERLKIESIKERRDPKYDIPCYEVKVINHSASKRNQVKVTAYIVSPEGMDAYMKLREELAAAAKQKLKELDRNGHYLYTPREAWKDYTVFKHYYLFVGYVYAMTAHKSQGSTIENVFVIERNINRISEDELRNKLKYTAFTRASKELHVLM